VKRFMARLRATAPLEARVVIVMAPGADAQVDYGEGPMVRDRESGKYKRVRLFVLTLRVQPEVGAPDGLEVVIARVGGAARARVPPARQRPARHRARQSARGRHELADRTWCTKPALAS